MNNRGYRRRPRKRITGRFYAFLTILVIIIVFICVLVNRGRNTVSAPPAMIAPIAATTPNIVGGEPTPVPQTESVIPADPGAFDTAAAPSDVSGQDASANAGDSSSVSSITDIYGDGEEYALIPEAEKVEISANDLSVTEGLPSEWRNILLLGSDSRDVKKVTRTDTIIIASVNAQTGRIKLVSIMRDLVVSAPNKKGEMKQVKINSLVNMGGINLLMKTINELFGMNITEYVLVNFASFQKVVDILGGVDMDVTAEEMEQVNLALGEMAKAAGYDQAYYLANKDALSLKVYGEQTHLTGIQALGYARIRHVGAGDYRRTERQRDLLDSILRKVKNDAGLGQLIQLATSMWGEINTNMDLGSAISLATTVIKNGAAKLDKSWRIPGTSTSFKSETRKGLGSALYDCDFDHNKRLLYEFIYQS